MNICLCGAQAGYPHYPDCPYPLFRATEAQEKAWVKTYEAIKAKQKSTQHILDLRAAAGLCDSDEMTTTMDEAYAPLVQCEQAHEAAEITALDDLRRGARKLTEFQERVLSELTTKEQSEFQLREIVYKNAPRSRYAGTGRHAHIIRVLNYLESIGLAECTVRDYQLKWRKKNAS